MIDLLTGWFLVIQYRDKQAATIANLVEQTWLFRYLRPTMITYDSRNLFLGHIFKSDLIRNKYRIKAKSETTANPKENSILERIHQVIANLVCTLGFQNNYLEEDKKLSRIVAAMYLAVHSNYHIVLQGTPDKLLFSSYMMLNSPFFPYKEVIRIHKQQLIDK